MRIWLLAVVLAAGALGTSPAEVGFAQTGPGSCRVPAFAYKHGTVTFTEHGTAAEVRVEVADTPDSAEAGLMCRTAMEPDAGMLFMFADDTRTPFWMKNTLIPLSIAFIDATWHIVGLMDMPVERDPSNPLPANLYAPQKPYRYALEVNQGFFARHGIDTKAEVRFARQTSAVTEDGCRARTRRPQAP